MTKRELYTAVIEGNITEEVINSFKIELEKIDKANELRKNTKTPHQEENEVIKTQIKEFFQNNPTDHFIEEIVSQIDGITRQRCTALCNQLIAEGFLSVKDVRVKNKGKRKSYTMN